MTFIAHPPGRVFATVWAFFARFNYSKSFQNLTPSKKTEQKKEVARKKRRKRKSPEEKKNTRCFTLMPG
jgi:hypothetical protein